MIDTEAQDELKGWLCERIGLVPTPDIRCIGSRSNSRIIGVVGFDSFNGASIMMHAAGEPGWLTRKFLWAVFHYPFEMCGVNMVIGLVPSGNAGAIRLNTHMGFKINAILEGAHPDGALWIMSMGRRECRFLNFNRNRHGQKIQAATST